MSKFRIYIRGGSLLLAFVEICWVLLLLLSVWSWADNVIYQQTLIQITLSLLVIVVCALHWWRTRHSRQAQIVLLSESGELQFMPEDGVQWQVTASSKLAGPLLYLHTMDRFDNRIKGGRWLAKDQFTYADFRRACRVICRCQRMQHQSNIDSSIQT